MDDLIAAAQTDPDKRTQLLRALMSGHVYIIASWESPQSTTISIQGFTKEEKSFIPIFSDEEHFKSETAGSDFAIQGVSIDATLVASMLDEEQILILNPGSNAPLELYAKELKQFVDIEKLKSLAKSSNEAKD